MRPYLGLSLTLLFVLSGCQCGQLPGDLDAGDGGGRLLIDAGDPNALADGGDVSRDGGDERDGGLTFDAGIKTDAGQAADGGSDPGFDWADLLDQLLGDGGLPEELACLPGGLPEFSLTGLLDLLAFETYLGFAEDGVKCGNTICDVGVPCCELCGYAKCAEIEDGGPAACPLLTRTIACDGEEDCNEVDNPVCCYSIGGTECRRAEDCEITIPNFFADGGFMLPNFGGDAGTTIVDAGVTPSLDAGGTDAGGTTVPGDGGMSMLDADDPPGQAFLDLLVGGVPVCRNLFQCNLLQGEICCTSERFEVIDLGLCLPALACLGGVLP